MTATLIAKPKKQRMNHLAARTVSSFGFVSSGSARVIARPRPVSATCENGCGGQCLSGCKDQCITVSK